MNLINLKLAVDSAIMASFEYGKSPEDVIVTLRIDREDKESVFCKQEIELHYNVNGQASGCVITAFLPRQRDKDSTAQVTASEQMQKLQARITELESEVSEVNDLLTAALQAAEPPKGGRSEG